MKNKETLEEVAEKIADNFEEPNFKAGVIYGFIEGAKWQQKQNKNLYSEEDLLNFGAFVRIEDKKEKRLFLIQDYYKKWLEKYKNK